MSLSGPRLPIQETRRVDPITFLEIDFENRIDSALEVSKKFFRCGKITFKTTNEVLYLAFKAVYKSLKTADVNIQIIALEAIKTIRSHHQYVLADLGECHLNNFLYHQSLSKVLTPYETLVDLLSHKKNNKSLFLELLKNPELDILLQQDPVLCRVILLMNDYLASEMYGKIKLAFEVYKEYFHFVCDRFKNKDQIIEIFGCTYILGNEDFQLSYFDRYFLEMILAYYSKITNFEVFVKLYDTLGLFKKNDAPSTLNDIYLLYKFFDDVRKSILSGESIDQTFATLFKLVSISAKLKSAIYGNSSEIDVSIYAQKEMSMNLCCILALSFEKGWGEDFNIKLLESLDKYHASHPNHLRWDDILFYPILTCFSSSSIEKYFDNHLKSKILSEGYFQFNLFFILLDNPIEMFLSSNFRSTCGSVFKFSDFFTRSTKRKHGNNKKSLADTEIKEMANHLVCIKEKINLKSADCLLKSLEIFYNDMCKYLPNSEIKINQTISKSLSYILSLLDKVLVGKNEQYISAKIVVEAFITKLKEKCVLLQNETTVPKKLKKKTLYSSSTIKLDYQKEEVISNKSIEVFVKDVETVIEISLEQLITHLETCTASEIAGDIEAIQRKLQTWGQDKDSLLIAVINILFSRSRFDSSLELSAIILNHTYGLICKIQDKNDAITWWFYILRKMESELTTIEFTDCYGKGSIYKDGFILKGFLHESDYKTQMQEYLLALAKLKYQPIVSEGIEKQGVVSDEVLKNNEGDVNIQLYDNLLELLNDFSTKNVNYDEYVKFLNILGFYYCDTGRHDNYYCPSTSKGGYKIPVPKILKEGLVAGQIGFIRDLFEKGLISQEKFKPL